MTYETETLEEKRILCNLYMASEIAHKEIRKSNSIPSDLRKSVHRIGKVLAEAMDLERKTFFRPHTRGISREMSRLAPLATEISQKLVKSPNDWQLLAEQLIILVAIWVDAACARLHVNADAYSRNFTRAVFLPASSSAAGKTMFACFKHLGITQSEIYPLCVREGASISALPVVDIGDLIDTMPTLIQSFSHTLTFIEKNRHAKRALLDASCKHFLGSIEVGTRLYGGSCVSVPIGNALLAKKMDVHAFPANDENDICLTKAYTKTPSALVKPENVHLSWSEHVISGDRAYRLFTGKQKHKNKSSLD